MEGVLASSQKYGSTWLGILTILLIIDNINFLLSYGKVLPEYTFSRFGLIVSILIMLSSVIANRFCLRYLDIVLVKKSDIGSKKNTFTTRLSKLVSCVLYLMLAILLIVAIQALIVTGYYTLTFALIVGISYSVSALILCLLAFKLFSWYNNNRSAELGTRLILLCFGINAVLVAAGCLAIATFNIYVIYTRGGAWVEGTPFEAALSREGPNFTTMLLLGPPYLPLRLGYFCWWIASAILLRHYSKRIGKFRYWILISLPLVSFLVGSASINMIKDSNTSFLSAMIVTISVITGGLLFGFAFFTISKSLPQNNQVPIYLKVAGYRVLLTALALDPGIIYAPFPMAGFAAWSTAALASFLFTSGIYSSAMSISYDASLRQLLRSAYLKEKQERDRTGLLDSIGTAQLEQDLQKKMLKVLKEKGNIIQKEYEQVESSLTEEDLKEYLHMIMTEAKERKN